MKLLRLFLTGALPRRILAGSVSVVVLGAVLGCEPKVQPPTPVPLAELPGLVEQAFGPAASGVRTDVERFVASLQKPDHSKAFLELQKLLGHSGLTREQTLVLNRALLTLNEALQMAQNEGNKAAAQTLRMHRENK